MYEKSDFADLLLRVRGGDSGAASELVGRYESAIRVAVRTRLSDPKLRRQFDSMDVCQSVLASFFLRAAAGQYDLRDPAQLVALLTKMAHNKLAMRPGTNIARSATYGGTCGSATLGRNRQPADAAPEQALGRDLVNRAFGLMDAQVREMAKCRARGLEWSEIAAQFGGTANARRKQFQRAVDRIARHLRLSRGRIWRCQRISTATQTALAGFRSAMRCANCDAGHAICGWT